MAALVPTVPAVAESALTSETQLLLDLLKTQVYYDNDPKQFDEVAKVAIGMVKQCLLDNKSCGSDDVTVEGLIIASMMALEDDAVIDHLRITDKQLKAVFNTNGARLPTKRQIIHSKIAYHKYRYKTVTSLKRKYDLTPTSSTALATSAEPTTTMVTRSNNKSSIHLAYKLLVKSVASKYDYDYASGIPYNFGRYNCVDESKRSSFTMGSVIGRGSYGKVSKAIRLAPPSSPLPNALAIKMMDLEWKITKGISPFQLREISSHLALTATGSPSIIPLQEVLLRRYDHVNQMQLGMVMPLADSDLGKVMDSPLWNFDCFNPLCKEIKALRFKWSRAAHKAVTTVHDNGFIHADVKPCNFFLKDGKLMLGDCGLMEKIKGERVSELFSIVTMNYRSIGLLSEVQRNYSIDIDKFSLAIVKMEIYLGFNPMGRNFSVSGDALSRRFLTILLDILRVDPSIVDKVAATAVASGNDDTKSAEESDDDDDDRDCLLNENHGSIVAHAIFEAQKELGYSPPRSFEELDYPNKQLLKMFYYTEQEYKKIWSEIDELLHSAIMKPLTPEPARPTKDESEALFAQLQQLLPVQLQKARFVLTSSMMGYGKLVEKVVEKIKLISTISHEINRVMLLWVKNFDRFETAVNSDLILKKQMASNVNLTGMDRDHFTLLAMLRLICKYNNVSGSKINNGLSVEWCELITKHEDAILAYFDLNIQLE
jgi:serine/threonine protein kinase